MHLIRTYDAIYSTNRSYFFFKLVPNYLLSDPHKSTFGIFENLNFRILTISFYIESFWGHSVQSLAIFRIYDFQSAASSTLIILFQRSFV